MVKENNDSQQHVRKGQQGQSLVEMAAMLVILFIILAGVLDLGRAYYTYLALQNAAGEGAVYGSMFPSRHYPCNPTCDFNLLTFEDPHNIDYRVRHENPNREDEWTDTTLFGVTVEPSLAAVQADPDLLAAGQYITVNVTYEYEMITPVIQLIAGDTVTLRATAVNNIVGFDNN